MDWFHFQNTRQYLLPVGSSQDVTVDLTHVVRGFQIAFMSRLEINNKAHQCVKGLSKYPWANGAASMLNFAIYVVSYIKVIINYQPSSHGVNMILLLSVYHFINIFIILFSLLSLLILFLWKLSLTITLHIIFVPNIRKAAKRRLTSR